MKTIRNIANLFIMIIMIKIFFSCDESKRFEISGDDTTPPSAPVFISSKPLPGGARIFYRRPADKDLLAVEASYINTSGVKVWFSASYFTDSLDVLGFDSEGEHSISLYAVDRTGNRSKASTETIISLEPAAVTVAKSVKVLPSFASMIVKWENILRQNVYLYVDFSYTKDGVPFRSTTVFDSYNTESRSIDSLKLYSDELVAVNVTVKDKYGNSAQSIDTSIVLLTDAPLSKTLWTLPVAGTVMGGAVQADGSVNDGLMNMVIDDVTEADVLKNFYLTSAANPWNINIDLGEKRELSRILTHQRHSYTDESVRGAYYRGDNILIYKMYIWDEDSETWEAASQNTIRVPIVNQESDYVTRGNAGDMAFLYPDEPKFSKPTRYFRFEALNGKYISEITLFGR
jgi:hypothetical protein